MTIDKQVIFINPTILKPFNHLLQKLLVGKKFAFTSFVLNILSMDVNQLIKYIC